MQWPVLTLDQEVPYYFSFLSSLPDDSITHAQIKHIWVCLVYIPSYSDMADTATTETSKLEDIDTIIYICANFLGLYSISSS